MRTLTRLTRRALPLAAILATAALAWADHGAGSRGSLNPWLEALLWGVLGLVVAMTVALIVTVFTRAPANHDKRRRHPR